MPVPYEYDFDRMDSQDIYEFIKYDVYPFVAKKHRKSLVYGLKIMGVRFSSRFVDELILAANMYEEHGDPTYYINIRALDSAYSNVKKEHQESTVSADFVEGLLILFRTFAYKVKGKIQYIEDAEENYLQLFSAINSLMFNVPDEEQADYQARVLSSVRIFNDPNLPQPAKRDFPQFRYARFQQPTYRIESDEPATTQPDEKSERNIPLLNKRIEPITPSLIYAANWLHGTDRLNKLEQSLKAHGYIDNNADLVKLFLGQSTQKILWNNSVEECLFMMHTLYERRKSLKRIPIYRYCMLQFDFTNTDNEGSVRSSYNRLIEKITTGIFMYKKDSLDGILSILDEISLK